MWRIVQNGQIARLCFAVNEKGFIRAKQTNSNRYGRIVGALPGKVLDFPKPDLVEKYSTYI
jgi:hypothetical protein